LGVGTPELFLILLVGYFVLGPSDLYKLTKEIGKFVQNFRTFTTEATSTIENNLESNLQLEEIRKAQRDLNEAFSFRRSINVDETSEAFEVNAQTERLGETGIDPVASVVAPATVSEAAATAAASGKKKKIRRRRKKQPEVDIAAATAQQPVTTDIPQDLDMTKSFEAPTGPAMDEITRKEQEEDAKAMADLERARAELLAERDTLESKRQAASTNTTSLRDERMARLKGETAAAQRELATSDDYDLSIEEKNAAANRFQAQLNGSWNDQIVADTEELQPLAVIMDQLALLEEEKIAADVRLEEEYKVRAENEESYYRQKRSLLEKAAQTIQTDSYASKNSSNNNTTAVV